MKPPAAPKLELRRASDFERDLLTRARTWIPSWSPNEGEGDFGLALLKIAARFNSEVAERLDKAGEKMALGFLDWLGIPAQAARPARMPVVFRMADTAQEPVLAVRPVKLQADVPDATVTFETETDLQVIPGQLAAVVAADPEADSYFLPPPGLTSLDPLEPLPKAWKLKNFAAAGSKTLQLDPGIGLAEDMLVEIAGEQYRIAKAKDDLIEIDPIVPPGDGLAGGTRVSKVETFRPFDGARNLQEHILYIGDSDLLNVEAPARIEIRGLGAIPDTVAWEYWGKSEPEDPADADPRWRELEVEEDPPPDDQAVVLKKPQGSVESTTIGTAESRWIRGRLVKSASMSERDSLAVRINPRIDTTKPPPELNDPARRDELPPVEIIVNTTPAPTNNFYLLGREPRLFDTVYIGSSEAFSKPRATAWIRFDLSDGVFNAIAAYEGWVLGQVLAAVDKAGALHLFRVGANGELSRMAGGEPLQPSASGTAAGSANKPISLTSSTYRPAVWSQGYDLSVAVAAKQEVWVWTERLAIFGQSGWKSWGIPDPSEPDAAIEGLAVIDDNGPALIALINGRLFKGNPTSTSADWNEFEPTIGANDVVIGIAGAKAELTGSIANRFLAVAEDSTTLAGKLYRVAADATANSYSLDPAKDVTPFAIQRADGSLTVVAVRQGTPRDLWANSGASTSTTPLDNVEVKDSAIDGHIEAGQLVAYCIGTDASGGATLVSWLPFDGPVEDVVFEDALEPEPGMPNGPVAVSAARIYLPGRRGGEIFAGTLGTRTRFVAAANNFKSVAAFDLPGPALGVGDAIAFEENSNRRGAKVAAVSPISATAEALFWLDDRVPRDTSDQDISTYATSGPGTQGTVQGGGPGSSILTLAAPLPDHTLLFVSKGGASGDIELVEIDHMTGNDATVTPALSAGPANRDYWAPTDTLQGRIYPALKLDAANNGWDINLAKTHGLTFPELKPSHQGMRLAVGTLADPNRPEWVALSDEWINFAAPAEFLVASTGTDWSAALTDKSVNPALAWEYWNGSGWWRLHLDDDQTNNFRSSGTVRFSIPDDLSPTEWAGKTNHWVRARLIGGDYGQETVSVVTEPIQNTNKTKQTVQRTTEGIQPPFALDVAVAYAVDEAIVPKLVLTKDSGALRDQSDANRTPGALVEIFTPLSVTLGRLSAPAGQADSASECIPDCECDTGSPSMSPASAPAASPSGSTPASGPGAGGRAIYLGFTSKLLGGPVNLLFNAAREADYDAIGPLRTEALIGDRFVAIVSSDETRALGETGLLKMSFDVPPLKADLFGQALSWLRLAPRVGSNEWKPSIAGAYPNGVWTRSAETMTRELLGSSDGRPALTVTLARPPLLRNTLELRVREPLGDEEVAALLEKDPSLVKSDETELPGHWVLWSQVPDPTDCGPRDRVYSLDEATGAVRFGDGLHGMIPPVGVDAIVAFGYERTDAPVGDKVAANLIDARDELNLVTPVESVETVIAAGGSNGGTPPESKERVLEFAPAVLRHRDRAVSLRDFEQLVRQKSEEVVQARAFRRNGGVRLVVVTKGADVSPSRAQQREWRRALIEVAPPSLGVPDGLTIEGPRVRRLGISLTLRVRDLDNGGRVASEAKKRLVARFEPAGGWSLGRTAREEDIAETLLDIPDLEGIVSINLLELDEIGRERPWQGAVARQELVTLAGENVRVGFDVMEVAA